MSDLRLAGLALGAALGQAVRGFCFGLGFAAALLLLGGVL